MTAFTERVEELLAAAREIAEVRGHPFAGTEHLLLAMTRQSDEPSLDGSLTRSALPRSCGPG
jgi:ATP-dependent Clp protease ATP-binding subunit ClpA